MAVDILIINPVDADSPELEKITRMAMDCGILVISVSSEPSEEELEIFREGLAQVHGWFVP